jgi:hypothetical protein
VSRPSTFAAFAATAALVLGLALPAGAAPPDRRAKDAAQLYQQGKYQEAAELYTKLRDEKQEPKFLCNLALCYLKMGYVDPGIETIRQCLATATLSADLRSQYEALLARVEARKAAAGGQPQEAVVPPAVDVGLVPVEGAGAPIGGSGQDPAAGVAPVPAPLYGVPAEPGGPGPVLPGTVYPQGAQPPLVPAPGYADPANPGYPGYAAGPPGYATPVPPGTAPLPVGDAGAGGEPRGKRRIPFGSYVTGAVGVVGTAMGVALVLHSQAIQQELDSSTGNAADMETLDSDLSRSKTGAVTAFIIGGAGLGAAVIWAIVAPSYIKPELAAGGLNVAVGPGSLGVSGRF